MGRGLCAESGDDFGYGEVGREVEGGRGGEGEEEGGEGEGEGGCPEMRLDISFLVLFCMTHFDDTLKMYPFAYLNHV